MMSGPADPFPVLAVTALSVQLLLVSSSGCPFRNVSLPWSERVDDLVGRLTLAEVMAQMSRGGAGRSGGPAPPVDRLGIGPYSWNTECLRGDASAGDATSFPQAVGLAATFSPPLVFNVSQTTSIEVRAKHNDYIRKKEYGDHRGLSCFSPVINIMRHPLWGRNQETYGEDPFLSAVLAAYFIKGLQGQNRRYVRASGGCKHFDAYGGPENIPVSKLMFDAKVTERDLRLTFLPAFKSCIDAGTYSIMCSYNSVNGVPACANERLLTDILRKEWGFKGYVVSDQGAIEFIILWHRYRLNFVDTVTACVNAGCNLELSANMTKPVYFSMIDAISRGLLSKEKVLESVKPLFYTRMRLGEFDPPDMNPYTKLNLSVIQSPEHRNLSLRAAMQSFVLLKNTQNFLPLKTKLETIAVVGPMADNAAQLFGDYSADINSIFTKTPLTGLKQLAAKLKYGAGCHDNRCHNYSQMEIKDAVAETKLIFVCLGTGQELESEGNDRANLSLPGNQLALLQDAVKFGAGIPVIVLLFNAGPLDITWADHSRSVVAIIECFFPAETTGEAIFRVVTGTGPHSNPAGRLPFTWPASMAQVPSVTNYTMHGRTYRYFDGDPLYPFGYGLSYSTFVYTSLYFERQLHAGKALKIKVTALNKGPYDGDEVMQVYVSWDNPSVQMPKLQLVAFERVFLPAGSNLTREFRIIADQLAVWDDTRGFIVEPGVMNLYVGGQQPNQRRQVKSNVLQGQFTITGVHYISKYHQRGKTEEY